MSYQELFIVRHSPWALWGLDDLADESKEDNVNQDGDDERGEEKSKERDWLWADKAPRIGFVSVMS